MNFKVSIKNRMCYYFDDIIKFKDFGLDNILLDQKQLWKYFCLQHFIQNIDLCKALAFYVQ